MLNHMSICVFFISIDNNFVNDEFNSYFYMFGGWFCASEFHTCVDYRVYAYTVNSRLYATISAEVFHVNVTYLHHSRGPYFLHIFYDFFPTHGMQSCRDGGAQ